MAAQPPGDEALQREITAGRITRQEADELHQKLPFLAFNMTVAGRTGALPKATLAYWPLHRQRQRLGSHPQAAPDEQSHAGRWWSLAIAVGLLRETQQGIGFVDQAMQESFCLAFCTAHPLDETLLRQASTASFRAIWRRWAEHDATLVGRLTDLLLGIGHSNGYAYAARILQYLDAPRTVGRLVAALDDPSAAVRMRAAQGCSNSSILLSI